MLPFAPNDLETIFESIMRNTDYRLMYNMDDSVMWKYQSELVEQIPKTISKYKTKLSLLGIKNPKSLNNSQLIAEFLDY